MQREILFKAKREDNGNWHFGSVIYNGENECSIYDCNKDADYNGVEVDPETVCQYTGLKDKNGIKIFDGDILKIIVGNDYEKDELFEGVVVFGRNGKSAGKITGTDYPCSYTLYVPGWYNDEGILGNRSHEYEIIGNIHDKKEG